MEMIDLCVCIVAVVGIAGAIIEADACVLH